MALRVRLRYSTSRYPVDRRWRHFQRTKSRPRAGGYARRVRLRPRRILAHPRGRPRVVGHRARDVQVAREDDPRAVRRVEQRHEVAHQPEHRPHDRPVEHAVDADERDGDVRNGGGRRRRRPGGRSRAGSAGGTTGRGRTGAARGAGRGRAPRPPNPSSGTRRAPRTRRGAARGRPAGRPPGRARPGPRCRTGGARRPRACPSAPRGLLPVVEVPGDDGRGCPCAGAATATVSRESGAPYGQSLPDPPC